MKDKPTIPTIPPISPIDEVKNAITAWADFINPDRTGGINKEAVIDYLNQGFCININSGDFAKWAQKKPAYIHAYPAIFNTLDGNPRLKFVLIDSSSDYMEQDNMDCISVKDFHYGESINHSFRIRKHQNLVSLPFLEGLRRNFIWKMYCNEWLQATIQDSASVFKAICIPFSDFVQLFTSDISDPSAIAFFGLTNTTTGDPRQYAIEFILTNELVNYTAPSTFYDISRPVPPFDVEIGIVPMDFNLLDGN